MIAKGNTQITISGEDNRRLRMMAAQAGMSAKSMLHLWVREAWAKSQLSVLDEGDDDEESLQTTSSPDAGEEA